MVGRLPRTRAFKEVPGRPGGFLEEEDSCSSSEDWALEGLKVSAAHLPRVRYFVEEGGCSDLRSRGGGGGRRGAPDEHEIWTCVAERTGSRPPDQVVINVYELSAFSPLNQLLAVGPLGLGQIGGALHAGVEVFGREWSYGGGSGGGSGIICEAPRSNKRHRFREAVVLDRTKLSSIEVAQLMSELIGGWRGEDYHWLHRNCLTFAHELCARLGVGPLPPWIDRLARGAGALHLGLQALADSVQDFTDGTRTLIQTLSGGPGICGVCKTKPAGPVVGGFADGTSTQAKRHSVYEEVFVVPEPCWQACGGTLQPDLNNDEGRIVGEDEMEAADECVLGRPRDRGCLPRL